MSEVPPNQEPPKEQPPAPPTNNPPTESDKKKYVEESFLSEILADLKEDYGQDLDLSFLPLKDQIQTLRALKRKSKAAETPNPPPAQQPPITNPAISTPEADTTIISLAERNKRGGEWYQKNIADRQGVRIRYGKS